MKARLLETPSAIAERQEILFHGALFAHWCRSRRSMSRGVWCWCSSSGTQGLTVVDDWSGFGQRTTASARCCWITCRGGGKCHIAAQSWPSRPASRPVSQLIQAAIDAGIAKPRRRRHQLCAHPSRPWADSGVERASDDPYIIRDIGDLKIRCMRLTAAGKAAGVLDQISRDDRRRSLARASIASPRPSADHRDCLHASEKLFELAGSAPPWLNITWTATGATRAPYLHIRCAGSCTPSATMC